MINLVYDRTQADITNQTWKGYYNATDLNRVESWCRYLADELNSAGYNITITTKTNWTTADLRTASEMERIRTNIRSLMTGFHYITKIYTNAEQFDYIKANNWEKILSEIYNMMLGMEDWYVYSGVSANTGQNRLWQNRFRHFFVPPPIVTPVEYITSTSGKYYNTNLTIVPNIKVSIDLEYKSASYPFFRCS